MKNNITAILISAGFSSRMGDFKPLLQYNGISFIENIVLKIDLICDRIIIVTGYNSEKINTKIALLPYTVRAKISLIFNENYELGMFTSLQNGIQNCNSDWVIYHFIDQPNLPEEFYHNFAKEINPSYDWIQPIYKERKGHPIIFGKTMINKIISCSLNSNLREITKSSDIIKKYWDCSYPEILTDIDTPSDLKKL